MAVLSSDWLRRRAPYACEESIASYPLLSYLLVHLFKLLCQKMRNFLLTLLKFGFGLKNANRVKGGRYFIKIRFSKSEKTADRRKNEERKKQLFQMSIMRILILKFPLFLKLEILLATLQNKVLQRKSNPSLLLYSFFSSVSHFTCCRFVGFTFTHLLQVFGLGNGSPTDEFISLSHFTVSW